MKKIILSALIGSSLILATSVGFATAKTSMQNNWNCTTNASSASTDADKASDDKLANARTSATSAFSAAEKNCRDCTKITCEVKK